MFTNITVTELIPLMENKQMTLIDAGLPLSLKISPFRLVSIFLFLRMKNVQKSVPFTPKLVKQRQEIAAWKLSRRNCLILLRNSRQSMVKKRSFVGGAGCGVDYSNAFRFNEYSCP